MLTRKNAILLSTMVLTSLPIAVRAEDATKMDHSKMNHGQPAVASGVNDYYAPAMDKMHKDMMAVKATGDIDLDFVNGMIPHHQGAVDMAKIVLTESKDPAIRKLAENIIQAQEIELQMMEEWKVEHEKKVKFEAEQKAKTVEKQPVKQ